jgi:hypothetical protein
MPSSMIPSSMGHWRLPQGKILKMKTQLHRFVRVLVLLSIIVLLSACRAKPAPSAGFADPALMEKDASVPFHKFWRNPAVDWSRYSTIYIEEVNTAHMLATTDWQKGERKKEIEKDVEDLRVYARETIMKAFREDPNQRFTVVDSPSKTAGTAVLEIALIEVVPSKVTLNALGYAPFGIGLTITAARWIANDKSSVAFEARIHDAVTGDVMMLAADREVESFAIIDLRGFKWYTHAHAIIDGWSNQFVKVLQQKPGEVVDTTPTFRLLPW